MSFPYINTHITSSCSYFFLQSTTPWDPTPTHTHTRDRESILTDESLDEEIITMMSLSLKMEGAEEELERRSKFLNSLIEKKKKKKGTCVEQKQFVHDDRFNIRVRASDMPLSLQNHAFQTATHILDSMSSTKIDSKTLALSLKKDFDSTYGPAWHCIVGTSFGSYVTHSLGGFLYFSIDKLYVLLFKTAVEPLAQ